MTYQDLYAVLIPREIYEKIEEVARRKGVDVSRVYSHVIEHVAGKLFYG